MATETGEDLERLRAALIRVAAREATTTYRDLAGALGMSPPGVIRRIAALLERSMSEDAEAGRPFLAAVVTSRAGSLPRRGFFQHAAALGRFQGNPDGPAARAFYDAERRAALAYWGGGPAGESPADPGMH